jgi:phage terminase large subunit-like protein
MTSPNVGMLVGVQTPSHQVVPEAVSSAAVEAIELAASVGLDLYPWQRLVLDGALGERADGRWSAFEVGLVVPRQNGKGAILEARELAGLFLFGEELILHSAHEFKTAMEAFRRVLALVESSRDLEKMVARVRTSHGEEGIELKSGGRLRFVARSSGSARGFSGSCVILDEAFNLPPTAMAALLPTLSAQPNPQVWYTSSHPPAVDELTAQLRRLKVRADSDDPGRLCWFEWSNSLDVDPADPVGWARANPTLGYRIDAEFVDTERQSLPEPQFVTERLGVWLRSESASKIPLDMWLGLGDESAECGLDGLVFAVDMPPDRSHVTVAVSDGAVVEIADMLDPDRFVEWMAVRFERYEPVAVVLDGAGPVASFVPDLDRAGVRVVVTRAREFAGACGRFYDAVVGGHIIHRGQAELDLAVAAAKTRKLGDAWAWARMNVESDISPIVAASLALFGAQTLDLADLEDEPKPLVAF